MAWRFDPSSWSDGVTTPHATDFQHIATDLHTRGASVDGGGYGRANTGFLSFLAGAVPGTQYTISAASWSGGTATVTIGTHTLLAGQVISVASVTPSGYNTASAVITSVASTTVSFAITSNPGSYTSGGIVTSNATAAAAGMAAMDPNGLVLYTPSSGGFIPSSAYAGATQGLTLANGANNNISPAPYTNLVTGPSASFSISGFLGGFDGRILDIYNLTGFTGSIKNSSGSSTANQIITRTGADIASFTSASLIYLGGAVLKWVVRYAN